MSKYRIYQDGNGYYVQEYKISAFEYPSKYLSTLEIPCAFSWVNIKDFKSLKQARKEKKKLETHRGKVIDE